MDVLDAADVLVHPSAVDAFPTALMEAMAAVAAGGGHAGGGHPGDRRGRRDRRARAAPASAGELGGRAGAAARGRGAQGADGRGGPGPIRARVHRGELGAATRELYDRVLEGRGPGERHARALLSRRQRGLARGLLDSPGTAGRPGALVPRPRLPARDVHRRGQWRGGGHVLAVTFDDAYESVGRLALPLLTELGVPATVFVADPLRGRPGATRVGTAPTSGWGHRWAPEIAVMGWASSAGWPRRAGRSGRTRARIRGCRRSAAVRSRTSWPGRGRTSRSASACRVARSPIRTATADRRVAQAARAAGYAAAGGLLPGRVSERNPLLFPRISVGRGWADATLRRRARPWQRRLQSSAALARGAAAGPAGAEGARHRRRLT